MFLCTLYSVQYMFIVTFLAFIAVEDVAVDSACRIRSCCFYQNNETMLLLLVYGLLLPPQLLLKALNYELTTADMF